VNRVGRIWATLALGAAVTLGSMVGAMPAPSSASSTTSVASVTDGWRIRMLAQVNTARLAAGVPAVRLCRTLNRVAGARARSMAATDTFSHVDLRGRGPGDRISAAGYRWTHAGENIAAGQPRVPEVMAAWRASPRHLRTMTDPGFTHVGFGYARDPDGRYRTRWVQDYASGDSCR
jgi:uncharacterized protein YkwD